MANQAQCAAHKRGEDTGELHEPHECSTCGALCDGDSPCLVEPTIDQHTEERKN